MIGAEEHFRNTANRTHVTVAERTLATAATMATKRGIPHLFLVNDNASLRLAGVDGAVLGRRHGIYQENLAPFSYISGAHAQLAYSVGQGWTITDKNSSNGTKVDGSALVPEIPCVLHNGSKVQLANVEFFIEIY